MLAKFLFTTTPGSIILASIIISISILISSRALKIKSAAVKKNNDTSVQAASPTQKPSQALPIAQPNQTGLVKVSVVGDPVLGDKNATLTLVEFSDYECPFCKKAFEEILPELKKNYIDTGKVKLVYKDLPLPFHQNAFKEAEAAQCAKTQGGDTAYFKYHDQIFSQTASGGTGIALDQLPTLAKDISLDAAQFQKCLDDSSMKSEVDKDLAEAEKLGVNGTPTWFLGKTISEDYIEGIKIVGAQPFSAFKSAIDQQFSQN